MKLSNVRRNAILWIFSVLVFFAAIGRGFSSHSESAPEHNAERTSLTGRRATSSSSSASTTTPTVGTQETRSFPRVRYVRSISSPDAASPRKSFFQRLRELIFATSGADRLVRPLGLMVDKDILYVTDPGSHSVFLFDLNKNSFEKVATAGDQELVSPIGMAMSKDRIFLSDSYLKKVFVYDRKFKYVKSFTDHPLQRPTGLAWDSQSGRLYIADTAAHQVLVYSGDGSLDQELGVRGTEPGTFNFPTHLWLEPGGTLAVVDALNFRVQRFSPDGDFLNEFGSQGDGSGDFASPKGIASDSLGNLYVVDALFDAVQIFDPTGNLLHSFGRRGTADGQFWLPNGVFIDDQDRIFIADSHNHRIQVFEVTQGGR